MSNSGSGISAPGSYPVRKPTDRAQNHGRVINPPRYMQVGGLSGPDKYVLQAGERAESRNPVAKVEKATNVKGAVDVSE